MIYLTRQEWFFELEMAGGVSISKISGGFVMGYPTPSFFLLKNFFYKNFTHLMLFILPSPLTLHIKSVTFFIYSLHYQLEELTLHKA